MNATLTSIKNHVATHPVHYAVAVATTVATAKVVKIAGEWNEFYKEFVAANIDSKNDHHIN